MNPEFFFLRVMWEVERNKNELTLIFSRRKIRNIDDFQRILFASDEVISNVCVAGTAYEKWNGKLAERYIIDLSCNELESFDIEGFTELLIEALGDANLRSKLRGIILNTNNLDHVQPFNRICYPALEYILVANARYSFIEAGNPPSRITIQ